MAKGKIQIPRGALPAIALISDNLEKLPLLKEVAESLPAEKRSPELISTLFTQKADLPLPDAQSIVTQLLSFQNLRYSLKVTAAEAYDAITKSLESIAPPEWKATHLERWKAGRPIIEQVLESTHPFSVIQKTVLLTYAHQNVLYATNIFCDIRPIFDDAGRNIQQMTVNYVLEMEYHDGSTQRHFYAALDANDIAELKKACERAEIKTITMRERFKALSCPLIVSGEDIDD